MTKVFAEICVLKPENTIAVVETLIRCGFAVVIRANAHDECGPTMFVHAYGERPFDEAAPVHRDLFADLERMLDPVGGDVLECGKGHTDTMGQVVPPVGLQFAIDVLDDHHGIMHRISCAEYAQDRFGMIMIQAAGLLANTHGKSIGNALARRLMLAALGPIDEDDDEDEDFVLPTRETA